MCSKCLLGTTKEVSLFVVLLRTLLEERLIFLAIEHRFQLPSLPPPLPFRKGLNELCHLAKIKIKIATLFFPRGSYMQHIFLDPSYE